MISSPDVAVDEIAALLKAAWTADSRDLNRLRYEGVAASPSTPSGQDPWARLTVRHTDGGQSSLGGSSSKLWNRQGVLTVQVFAKLGQGLSVARLTAKMVANAYEGATTPGAIWFRNVRVNEVASDGAFDQVNVIAEFTYDEAR